MLKLSGTNRQRAATLLMAVLCLVVFSQAVVLAQNLGAAPQVNVAVQGQTGAQPEGAFLNLVNWIGNVLLPLYGTIQVVMAVLHFAGVLERMNIGDAWVRNVVSAMMCFGLSGLLRLAEFWISNGTAGVR